MNKSVGIKFILFGLCVLLFGTFIGILGGLQYLDSFFLKEILPFNQMRALHVSSMISWIILGATGGIYFYISVEHGLKLYSSKLASFHFWLYLLTGVAIYISLITGVMGGREYLVFLPALMIPILLGWVVFAFNYLRTVFGTIRSWPVYLWMWCTGIFFMIFHLTEANFWMIDYFRGDYIRDLSVQWKSYGSFTGSFNLLVYGTAIFLMSRIKKDSNIARSKQAFFFYFLGLTNLMFGWAHHIYPVPGTSWIRGVAYATSMTEWIVIANMITHWIKSLSASEKKEYSLSYRMLLITDIWVFINVLLALLMSIPAINHYTHGSHITVAHSMGTTIGIDTTILLASALFLMERFNPDQKVKRSGLIRSGYTVFNLSLMVFISSLIVAGWIKGQWQYSEEADIYSLLIQKLKPFIYTFVAGGAGIFVGLLMMGLPLIKGLYSSVSVLDRD